MKKTNLIAYLLCIIYNTIFCIHYYFAKIVMTSGVNPLILSAVRGIIGGLFLLLIYRDFFKYLNLKLIGKISVVAFFGFFLNQFFFLQGVKLTSPLNTSIIINTIPIMTTLFAIAFFVEKFHIKKVFGPLLGFGCVILLSGINNNFSFGEGSMGDLFVFLNVVFYCLSVIISKRILQNDTPFYVLPIGVLLLGGLMHLIAGANTYQTLVNFAMASTTNVMILGYQIIVSTAIVYLLIFMTLKMLPPSKSMIFAYAQPIIIVLIDYIFLSKAPSLIVLPIFLGIAVSGYLVISAKE